MPETRIDEIDDGIFRLHTAVASIPGGFSFNQYLVLDDEPLLFHAGPRSLFAGMRAAASRVLPVDQLRWIAFSHGEDDESGSLASWIAAAPHARPVCSRIAAMVGNADVGRQPREMNDGNADVGRQPREMNDGNADVGRQPRAMADGETLAIGRRRLRWLDAPHVPHGWDCGYMFDETSRTLFCGDLFTQGGLGDAACVETDILGPSEAMRAQLDYYAHGPNTRPTLEKVAATAPRLLACMHGSAWRGDGAALIRQLAASLG